MKNFRPFMPLMPLCALAAICVTYASPIASLADVPGHHPGYMHAIEDLRTAKGLLARPDAPNVEGDEIRAVREIDGCLHDLTQAAWFDGKNIHERPYPEAGLDRGGRFHQALELLRKAHSDMDREEDDPAAIGLQSRAVRHVDRAIGFTRRAIGEKFDDGFCACNLQLAFVTGSTNSANSTNPARPKS